MEPSLRLTARRKSLSGLGSVAPRRPPLICADPSSAEVTNIVSRHRIGVAALQLGIFARHKTFSVSVQVSGRLRAVEELPFELGPSHCGQFAHRDPARNIQV